jgi:redox-sensitive bicupin YhaK (pirin superfamily)
MRCCECQIRLLLLRALSSGSVSQGVGATLTFLFLFLLSSCAALEQLSSCEPMSSPLIKAVSKLGFPWQTVDPFLFCVFHRDLYPAGNAKDMTAPVTGNGADFDWSKPFRMYHGIDIPGFPAHPHRGFETVTCTVGGGNSAVVDHCDSKGNGARYGSGDVQWLTAGAGIAHGELFPLRNVDEPNHLKLFQIWLNLPKKDKLAEPAFVMHWAEDIQHAVDGKSSVTVWAGQHGAAKGLAPPPSSWAANADNDVAIFHIVLQPQGSVTVAPARIGGAANRRLYLFEGASGVTIGGASAPVKNAFDLDAAQSAELKNGGDTVAEFLMLQGRPIGEPVVARGPFVMNEASEIGDAYRDYAETRFGGWPWPSEAHVFPREKGRFTVVNGVETVPPTKAK